jgi:hypothetical protein
MARSTRVLRSQIEGRGDVVGMEVPPEAGDGRETETA